MCGQEGEKWHYFQFPFPRFLLLLTEIVLVYFLEGAKPSQGLLKVSGISTKCEECFYNEVDDRNRHRL